MNQLHRYTYIGPGTVATTFEHQAQIGRWVIVGPEGPILKGPLGPMLALWAEITKEGE